jgi:hypothetical protein
LPPHDTIIDFFLLLKKKKKTQNHINGLRSKFMIFFFFFFLKKVNNYVNSCISRIMLYVLHGSILLFHIYIYKIHPAKPVKQKTKIYDANPCNQTTSAGEYYEWNYTSNMTQIRAIKPRQQSTSWESRSTLGVQWVKWLTFQTLWERT